MAKYNVGDTVFLNSGGPAMTIVSVVEEDSDNPIVGIAYEAYTQKFGKSPAFYGCNWFVGTTKKEDAFPEAAISTSPIIEN
ncbi:MAG: DUF2158 domain-containing protein [Bacteroidaceae bacterium]|nr:DUF2158 domain-containing protein [Bacteroidaceae bacterium]